MPFVHERVQDFGIDILNTEAESIFICSQEPVDYTEATATYALGEKDFGVPGDAFGAPAAGTPDGRAVSSANITDGTVTATGTATHWAVVDKTNSRLLATGPLASSQAVTNGNIFTLPPFTIRAEAASVDV